MTPKEKAQELVEKYYQTTPNEAWYCPPIGSITSSNYSAWEQAKKCALIAVDEMIESTTDNWSHSPFWQQVRKEIESL